MKVSSSALRGTTATISYDGTPQSILVAQNWGEITLDASGIGDEWNSGEALAVTLVDGDMNFNSLSDDDLSIANADHIIPTVKIGSPITLADISTSSAKPIKFIDAAGDGTEHYVLGQTTCTGYAIESFSDRLNMGLKSQGAGSCRAGISIGA